MKLLIQVQILLLAVLCSQCGSNKFAGADASKKAPGSIEGSDTPPRDDPKSPKNPDFTGGAGSLIGQVVDLSCEDSTEKTVKVGPEGDVDIKTQDNANVAMSIKGRFCPTVSNNLTVLFVIDYSGSMGPNKPDLLNKSYQPPTGNDPRAGSGDAQTCGRLQAVEAIMAKFKDGDNVKVGTVAFAGDIVDSHSTAPIDGKTFRNDRLNAASKLANFCSYIAPDLLFASKDMAIAKASVSPKTNYEAAFNKAYEFLKNTKGRKAVYFITDGRPTAGTGLDPLAAGIKAANKLKTLENLYVNAFFLQFLQSGLQEDKQGFDNLVQTVGETARVVRVNSAAQLAIEVGKDQPGSFEADSVSATLSIVPSQPETDLKLIRFNPDPQNAKAWVFETEAFKLLGEAVADVPHLVKVTAKAKDGTIHTSNVKILFQKSAK